VVEEADVGPNPVLSQDLVALVGVLAVLEGELWGDELPDHASGACGRFIHDGLLGELATPHDLRQAIHDLNHRLRYALGEYPEPPPSIRVPE
jgi:hypothetical protein